MTAEPELLPLPNVWKYDGFGKISAQFTADHMRDYARANVAHATAARDAEISRLNEAFDARERMLSEIEQAHAVEIEALRAEGERLQKIIEPKREEECMTLDHWRMRAYDLEANWSRTSRAANEEAEARKGAEARAERLAEALREMREYVTAALQDQREAFAGHEDSSDIPGIEADLHKVDALLRGQENDDA